MGECTHKLQDGTTWIGQSKPPPYECVFCEMDRLRAQLTEVTLARNAYRDSIEGYASETLSCVGQRDRAIAQLAEVRATLSMVNEAARDGLRIAVKALEWYAKHQIPDIRGPAREALAKIRGAP